MKHVQSYNMLPRHVNNIDTMFNLVARRCKMLKFFWSFGDWLLYFVFVKKPKFFVKILKFCVLRNTFLNKCSSFVELFTFFVLVWWLHFCCCLNVVCCNHMYKSCSRCQIGARMLCNSFYCLWRKFAHPTATRSTLIRTGAAKTRHIFLQVQNTPNSADSSLDVILLESPLLEPLDLYISSILWPMLKICKPFYSSKQKDA
jgi:hypothetical protein